MKILISNGRQRQSQASAKSEVKEASTQQVTVKEWSRCKISTRINCDQQIKTTWFSTLKLLRQSKTSLQRCLLRIRSQKLRIQNVALIYKTRLFTPVRALKLKGQLPKLLKNIMFPFYNPDNSIKKLIQWLERRSLNNQSWIMLLALTRKK